MRCLLVAAMALAVPGMAFARINITIDHGSIWQTKKIGEATEGFAQIHNAGDGADTLTAWSCPLAGTTQLVSATGKPLTSLEIPAGMTVRLSASGPHLLLTGTHFTVDFGSAVPCALTFQQAGQLGLYLNAVPAPESPKQG